MGGTIRYCLVLLLTYKLSLVACTAQRSSFAASTYPPSAEEEDYEDSSVSSTQHRAPNYADSPYLFQQNAIPIKPARAQVPQVQYRQPIQQGLRQEVIPQAGRPFSPQPGRQQLRPNEPGQKRPLLEEEEEEIEEPDRLTQLLPQSKFACTDKNTGYYADEGLGCEVFHYCQENARHSWICPEGFTFHQVHLICMPPGGDNICDKSSKYHFVNDYLYKPINLEEHQHQPNTSLRYSDRYYPDTYHQDQQDQQHRHSIRVNTQQLDEEEENIPQSLLVNKPRASFRQETNLGQVFRSPNEVVIPLQQRRPQYLVQKYYDTEK